MPSEEELRAAVARGAGVFIAAGSRPRAVFSLAFLEPVIESLPALAVESEDTITDGAVLARAGGLVAVHWYARSDAPIDLAGLPSLRAFAGVVGRATRSVLANPHLEELHVEGRMPARAHVAGRVQKFSHLGARADGALPSFAHDTLTEFTRAGAGSFDLRQLTRFDRLRKVRFDSSGVTHVGALGALPELEDLMFNVCRSPEGWDDLPHVPRGFLLQPDPTPSPDVVRRLSGLPGWAVTLRREAGTDGALFLARQLDDEEVPAAGWTWAMEESGQGWWPELGSDDIPMSSADIDATVEQIADTLGLEVLPDSEGGFVCVYFRNESDARTVTRELNQLLHGKNSETPKAP